MKYLVLAYALLIMVGGIIGHYKSASTASLVSGLVFGTLLFLGALGLFFHQPWGYYLSLATSVLLSLFFIFRFVKTGVFLPPGLLALVSLIVSILLFLRSNKNLFH